VREAPHLPPASKFIEGTAANPRVAELPPASKVVVGPTSETAHLPAASTFKPGLPGDIQVAKALAGVAGRPGEVGGTGSALQSGGRGQRGSSGGGGGRDDEISELQERIDRLLLIFAADHPDVVALQRRIDQLYAERGPLSNEELAEARHQLAACWQRASPGFGMAGRPVNLQLVLDRDGEVREARVDDAEASKSVTTRQLLAALRGCGPLPLPPERYLLWQRLNMRVGAK
jgi:hypothetical protein